MDDLRWILAVAGAVLVAAIYLSGRFEREEWRRDRDGFSGFSKAEAKPKTKSEKTYNKRPEHKPETNVESKPDSNPARETGPTHKIRQEPRISLPDERVTDDQAKVKVTAELSADEQVSFPPGSAKEGVKEAVKEEKATPTPFSAFSRSERKDAPGINSEDDVKKAMEAVQQEESIKPQIEERPVSKEELKDPVEAEKVEIFISDEKEEADTEEGSEITAAVEKPGKDNWEDAVLSVSDRYIEDEIVGIDIPEELSELDSLKQEEDELEFKPGIDEPEQQELVLEVEPLILVLTVMAKGDAFLEGKSIRRVLENSGMKCDDRGIYQFHMTGKKDAVFSVVSVIEPGVFERDTIDEYETPGLTFICQLPGPLPNKDMFRIMQMKALNIADKLGAKLCDDRRNLLTEQATTHYNDRIAEFDRELVLVRKKQG